MRCAGRKRMRNPDRVPEEDTTMSIERLISLVLNLHADRLGAP
jgi:hypothetical protein